MKNLGAGFIFIYKERILLLKKSDKDVWDIPGGRKQRKETYLQAATRETIEEIGVIPNFEKVGFYFREDKNNKYKIFYAKVVNPFKCFLSDEHEDYDWFPIKKLPQKLHKKISEAIDYLIESIKKEQKNDWFIN